MNARTRNLVLLTTLAAAAPAFAETAVPTVGPAGSGAQSASIPDFSGIWWHPSLPGLEPPASGPGPVTNRSRANVRQQKGISNYNQLVGDYTNPILKPQSAETVKKFGEISLRGITFPSPANQCWPEPVPYIYKNFAMQIFQHSDRLTIIYEQDHEVRHVRMNEHIRRTLSRPGMGIPSAITKAMRWSSTPSGRRPIVRLPCSTCTARRTPRLSTWWNATG